MVPETSEMLKQLLTLFQRVIIKGNRSVGGGFQTHDTATFVATGNGFIAKGITFRNTAGAASKQAVALLSTSDSGLYD
ncbi:pectinesterase [Vigna unguiculata]|uniref:Pectinesterase n=1 Tax=Vigna unguiculata TaxID=3917 RepID=A0A4D6NNH7_VIGUN|nr:pectinesterase [Vigna unguiculata]